MARDHETSEKPNDDGGTHTTKHSYSGSDSGQAAPNVRRSHDTDSEGNKSGDHVTDQTTGTKYNVTDSDKHSEGDVTDKSGKSVERPSLQDFQEKHKDD